MTAGQLIRQARLERKITLNKFAKMVGISGASISMIERGYNKASEDTLKKIADILNLDFVLICVLCGRIPTYIKLQIKASIIKNPKCVDLFRATGDLTVFANKKK